ncbi:MAG: hypothetical protein ACI9S8_000065 [Chlamydiales bacterium]
MFTVGEKRIVEQNVDSCKEVVYLCITTPLINLELTNCEQVATEEKTPLINKSTASEEEEEYLYLLFFIIISVENRVFSQNFKKWAFCG